MGLETTKVTWHNIDQHFAGVMIEVNEPFTGKHFVPGWECKICGWRVGTLKLPPAHMCPDDGKHQREKVGERR